MFGTLALAAGTLFVVLAAARLRATAPRQIGTALMIAGIAGAVFAVVHWQAIADSRWLVGGLLLLGAEAASLISARSRPLATVTLILAVLATALFAVATAMPRA